MWSTILLIPETNLKSLYTSFHVSINTKQFSSMKCSLTSEYFSAKKRNKNMHIMTKNTIRVKTGEDNDIKVVKKVVDVWTKNYFFDKETYAIIVPEIKGLFLNVSIFEKNQVGKNLNIFIRSYLKYINISMYLFSSFFWRNNLLPSSVFRYVLIKIPLRRCQLILIDTTNVKKINMN